jgi:hypothetical protein
MNGIMTSAHDVEQTFTSITRAFLVKVSVQRAELPMLWSNWLNLSMRQLNFGVTEHDYWGVSMSNVL